MDTQFDQSIDQFEDELKSGNSPSIEGYLVDWPEESKQRLLNELISLEIFYRLKNGTPVCFSEYARFGQAAAKHAEKTISENGVGPGTFNSRLEASVQATEKIGPYRLLQKIGEGGMGDVWMAQQEEPVKRLVALKLVKSELASKEVVARFEAEKQALAMMDHQNIARVLDAGTKDDGCPYFVMELIKGIPITQYCDDHKLSVQERLQLFEPVCKAAQHAHQKRILHRDLKPSNVLVTLTDGKPVPKVIDFGLAKATEHSLKLTDKTMFTEFGKVVGTLQYMSPEQAEMNGLDVDARSDVYSLGVMLYEILAGSTPLEKETLGSNPLLQVLKIIREKDPPRPSSRLSSSSVEASSKLTAQRKISLPKLQKILEGDLDWVVMKSLEKDRTRRYQTASDLGRDISNYLAGAAVNARPPSTWYRFQKFTNRNRGLVASLIAIGFASCLGIAGLSYGYIQANKFASTESGLNSAAGRNGKVDASGANDLKRASEPEAPIVREFSNNNTTCYGHDGIVYRVAFSPDGSRVASASADRTIKLWDVQSGKDVATLIGHSDRVGTVAYSADGQIIASASYDGTIKLWNARSFQEIASFIGHEATVADVAFSPNSSIIASASDDKAIKLWDINTGQEVATLKGHTGEVARVVFSPDGSRIVSASVDASIRFWDAKTGEQVAIFSGHSGGVGSIAFSPDGKRLASASNDVIKLWDVKSGQALSTLKGHAAWIHNVTFSPDGTILASASSDETIKLWNPKSGEEITTLKGHEDNVVSVVFSADGAWIASASFDKTVKLWHGQAE